MGAKESEIMEHLKTPISEEKVRGLQKGDNVYIYGVVFTLRDAGHMRALALAEGEKMPVDLRGSAVFHCGPIMRKLGEKWQCVVAGPTTSARLDTLEPRFIEKFRPSAIIGKGGMGRETLEMMEKCGCVYLASVGGTAAVTAQKVVGVKEVFWDDLGMPEAIWAIEFREFGPLVVAMDSHGGSIYDDVAMHAKENMKKARARLGLK